MLVIDDWGEILPKHINFILKNRGLQMNYIYKFTLETMGRTLIGVIIAPNKADALKELNNKGLAPASLEDAAISELVNIVFVQF